MEFRHIILEKLHAFFTECGLKIAEQSENIIRYESVILHISLAHNPRENSNTLWVGSKYTDDFVEIDDQVLRDHFNSGLKFNNLPQETFINNALLFFMGDGEKLLKRNPQALSDLEKFSKERSSVYMNNLIEQQNLEAADRAWKDGNYSDVIKYLEKINQANLPSSYKQKYKIAQNRLDR